MQLDFMRYGQCVLRVVVPTERFRPPSRGGRRMRATTSPLSDRAGSTTYNGNADYTLDGDVDLHDLALLLIQFGNRCD